MIFVEVFKSEDMWNVIEPSTGRNDSGTAVRSAVENLLLKYNLIDVKAIVTKITDSNGVENVVYHNPNVSVIITKEQLN